MKKNIFFKYICSVTICAIICSSILCYDQMEKLSETKYSMAPLSHTDCRYQDKVVKIADFILSLQCSNGAIPDCKNSDTVNTDSNMEYALIGLGSAYELTADKKYLSGVKKGIRWLAARECMTPGKWQGSFWYQYNTSGKHLVCKQGKNITDVRGVDTTSALFTYLLYLDHRMDPDSDLTAQYKDNALSALDFIRKNNLDSDNLSRSSWQKNSTGKWSIYNCKYSADQGDVYLGFHAAAKLYGSDTYRSLADNIKRSTEEKLYDDTLGRYCTSIEETETDKSMNSFDPIQSQGFLPWIFGSDDTDQHSVDQLSGSDAANFHSIAWLSGKLQSDGSISCYKNDPKFALSIAMLGMGENATAGASQTPSDSTSSGTNLTPSDSTSSGTDLTNSYKWLFSNLLDKKTGGIHDSSSGMEEDCNVAGLCLIALTKMLPFKQPMIYGVTLNDVTAVSISTVIDALDAMDPKPTVRIVMRPELSARKYKNILKSIHGHAYIMLCPCDSSYLKHYKSSGKYVARFRQCVASLSPYVDIWETGNEINGEGWTGLSKKEAAKYMYSAWKYLYSKGMTTELTPYEFSHGDQSIDMIPWLKKYVPQQMRDHIDHVLMSYYDDDNKNGHDDWQSTFDQLAALFPNSRIGFGECGFSKPHAYDETFKNQVRSYYGLKPFNDQYEGGYFWWYWQEDCLPYGYKL
jgi:hypothetical protein